MFSDFYGSYYEHGCSIINDRDVLFIDIKGSACFPLLKRWWYNLFLLSYTNNSNSMYYHSTHAMKVERQRHYRYFRNTIHPLSKFKNIWDCFLLHTILFNKLIFYHSSSLVSAELPLFFYFLGVFFEIIIIFDIYVNARCGYIDRITKKVVLDLNEISRNYCSTKLFFHVAGAMPMHVMMFLRYGLDVTCRDPCKANYFMCTLVILSSFSLLRFIEASKYWARRRQSYGTTTFFRLLRILVVAIMTMIQFVSFTDTIILLNFMRNDYVELASYYSIVVYVKYNFNQLPNFKLFAYDVERIFKGLALSVGCNKVINFYLDRFFCILKYCLAAGFYFWGVVEVFTCISRSRFQEDQITKNKAEVHKLAKCRRLPDRISIKLEKYYDFNMANPAVVEMENEFYKSLPFTLKKEILTFSYSRLLSRVPYFSEWPTMLIDELVLLLKGEIFMQYDVVAEAGTQGEGLFILDVGMMAVYSSNNQEMGQLIDGDYFGELSLITDKEVRTSHVVAVSNCKVLILGKSSFRQFMRGHPTLFFELKSKLKTRYSERISSSNVGTSMKMFPKI